MRRSVVKGSQRCFWWIYVAVPSEQGRSPGVTSPRHQLTLATKYCMVAYLWVYSVELYAIYVSAAHNIEVACRCLENLYTCA